jgi:glutaredoxin
MRILFIVWLLLASFAASAEIYTWTDKHGVVHYEDKQPEKNDNIRPERVETVELSPIQILDNGRVTSVDSQYSGLMATWMVKAGNLKAAAQLYIDKLLGKTTAITNETLANQQATLTGTAAASRKNTVHLYTTAWCGACKKTKHWLNQQGIPYTEYDIEKDNNAALRMRELGGGNGVPFAVINSKTFQGFDPAGYKAALH